MYEWGKVKKFLGNKIGLQVILEQCERLWDYYRLALSRKLLTVQNYEKLVWITMRPRLVEFLQNYVMVPFGKWQTYGSVYFLINLVAWLQVQLAGDAGT